MAKRKKYKQRSTKHTHKTKDRVTQTPLKTGGELGCSGKVSSSCSNTGTRRVNLVTNPVMNEEMTVYDKWNISISYLVVKNEKRNISHCRNNSEI